MAKKQTPETPEPGLTGIDLKTLEQLAHVFAKGIELAKPKDKITAANRKPGDPWQPKDGSKKLKLKRKMFQHGMPIDPDVNDNETIDALNRLKTGKFANWFKVYKRKDGGIEIDYPIKTASQKMKTSQLIGGRGLLGLCEICIEEAKNPQSELTEDTD